MQFPTYKEVATAIFKLFIQEIENGSFDCTLRFQIYVTRPYEMSWSLCETDREPHQEPNTYLFQCTHGVTRNLTLINSIEMAKMMIKDCRRQYFEYLAARED